MASESVLAGKFLEATLISATDRKDSFSVDIVC